MTVHARLFLDETGSFSTPDDMRLVGGLLTVASAPVEGDLRQIHDTAANEIEWPVRLHAFELVQPGSHLAMWYRLAGSSATFLDARDHRTMAAWEQRWTTLTTPLRGTNWAGKVDRIAGLSPDRNLDARVRAIGQTMFRRVRESLRRSFTSWCGAQRRAFVIAGHVADTVPPGQPAYDAALAEALRTAWRVAERAGAADLHVKLARWSANTRHTPAMIAHDVLGTRAIVDVTEYADGGPGVWLADSLLAWLRGPPGRADSLMLTDLGARACIRAGSSELLPEARPETTRYTMRDHYIAAVHETTALLRAGAVP